MLSPRSVPSMTRLSGSSHSLSSLWFGRPRHSRLPHLSWLALVASLLAPASARAVDLPKVGDTQVRLDITETSIVAQRFLAREGEDEKNQGYFVWLNRLNMVLQANKFTLGARLDSALYALRPEDRTYPSRQLRENALVDGTSRYRDSIYPAKLYAVFKVPGLEVTAGDAYAQLGRGLVLSLRKVDELGIDTTAFGGKVSFQKDPVGVMVIAGFLNPTRVDEPTGRALFLSKPIEGFPSVPLFGSDRVVAGQISVGRGWPVVLTTNFAHFSRCAPYRYDAQSNVIGGALDRPFGSCDERDKTEWFPALRKELSPTLEPSMLNASQSLELPSIFGHGSLYVEGVYQSRGTADASAEPDHSTTGNAIYAALTANGGPLTNTLELKSYRNFYNVAGAVNVSKAPAFANVAYSSVPTAEPIISDSMFGFYNVCVNGVRNRVDARLHPSVLVYTAVGYSVTKSEVTGGGCDSAGGAAPGVDPKATTNFVTELQGGVELRFDRDRSFFFANTVIRNDVLENGEPYYKERAVQYTLTKFLSGPFAFEIAGRHRLRYHESQNQKVTFDAAGNEVFTEFKWVQGEHYTALKIAPQWVITHGLEYTSEDGFPAIYNNGSLLYRFTTESNLKVLVGQQRGGLRCVSGICRLFPAFSGARVELTLRF